MLVYPQLSTGALSQFPIRKRQRRRTVTNATADGRSLRFADPSLRTTEWKLEYAALTDEEANQLEEFFRAAEGTLNGFVFADPTANLLTSTEALGAPIWERDPELTLTGGRPSPAAGKTGWQLTNHGSVAQGLWQSIPGPGAYTYTLSLSIRSNAAASLALVVGERRAEHIASDRWRRVALSATGGAEEAARFGIEVAAGMQVEVFGPQAEAQPAASMYRSGVRSGIYENARLASNSLAITATGPNQHSCSLQIIHVDHL